MLFTSDQLDPTCESGIIIFLFYRTDYLFNKMSRPIIVNLVLRVILKMSTPTTIAGPEDAQYLSRVPSLRVQMSVIDSPELMGKYIQVRKRGEYCCFI